MKVRDRTLKKEEYKGRPTEAFDMACPCRPCFSPHDCGHNERCYREGRWVENRWKMRMECVTHWNGGCPIPIPEPKHIAMKTRPKCKRCGCGTVLIRVADRNEYRLEKA